MTSRILMTTVAAAVLALALVAGAIQTPLSAQAAPPPPCPAAPGIGTTPYRMVATLPVGALASGICINLAGTGGTLNSGTVVQAPPACPALAPPAVGAGGSMAWADWGVSCVAGGQSVVLQFMGMPGIPLGRQTGAAVWGPSGIITDATVWPAQCPAAPLMLAPIVYTASAVVPAGGPYDSVCITIPGAGGQVNTPAVLVNPPSCGAPALSAPNAPASTMGPFFGAAVDQFWVDWTVKCASAGTLMIQFRGPPGLAGLCAACATWLDGAVMGDVTITQATSVGGVAEAPDAATLAQVRSSSGGSGSGIAWYAGVGGAVALMLAASAGWYLTRRRRA
ncbi:MAG TPA: hypothetical protein VEZ14_02775 [Dehalococcoidia bacterium]|nr:hypothetical protein [Dehalococcoidia bacterium]